MVSSTLAAQLVTRVGVKPVLLVGLSSLTGGLLYLTQVSAGGAYVTDLLPGFVLMALGIGFSFVPTQIAALGGVQPSEAGLASGLINTSQQIGGALGIAVVSSFAAARTEDALSGGASRADALVTGFQGALFLSVTVALLGLVAGLTLIRRDELAPVVAEVEPAEPALDLAA
jgi:MFS family permease